MKLSSLDCVVCAILPLVVHFSKCAARRRLAAVAGQDAQTGRPLALARVTRHFNHADAPV